MKKACIAIMIASVFLILGIVGGVECGEPIANALWCFPLFAILFLCAHVANFFD